VINGEFILNTVSLGSLYALLALGLVFVYGILKLVNFAYGEYLMVAGYVMFALGTYASIPWYVTMLIAILAAALTSYLTELVAFRPVRTKSLDAMLITSFAVSVLLQNAALLFVSPRARAVQFPAAFSRSIAILGVTTPLRNVLTIITALVVLTAMTLLMKYTVLGIAMRAAADKFTATRLMGVPANLVISVAFIISGFLAGVVSIFWIGRSASVDPLIGFTPLLIALISIVIGGMHSLVGAVVGGFVYGLVFNVLSIMLPASLISYRDAFMFAIVILFLLLRPEGLIKGGYTEERVG
jgi:branched-chain amino acid transport system permease protein